MPPFLLTVMPPAGRLRGFLGRTKTRSLGVKLPATTSGTAVNCALVCADVSRAAGLRERHHSSTEVTIVATVTEAVAALAATALDGQLPPRVDALADPCVFAGGAFCVV